MNSKKPSYRQYGPNLRVWRPGKLAKGTFAMTVGLGLRTAGQAGVFLIVARTLRVEAYGAYAAVLALASALGSFSGLGVQMIMMREVARDSAIFASAWGATLVAIALSTPALMGIYLLGAWAILPAGISWPVVLFVGVAELLFAPFSVVTITAYQGHDRIGRAAHLVLVPIVPRVAAALALLLASFVLPMSNLLVTWSGLYALAGLVAAIYSGVIVYRDLGLPVMPNARMLRNYAREGLAFALSGTALKLYTDIDKTMLARLNTLEGAGAYSAAHRLVDMVGVPLQALFGAAAPRFFSEGEAGTRRVTRYALRILPFPIIYAVVFGSLLFEMADLMPRLLGNSFAPAVDTLRWLAWLPLAATLRRFLQVTFVASGRQYVTSFAVMVGAALNVILNLWAIPRWGIHGAVLATYGAEAAMMGVLVIVALRAQ